MSVRCDNGLEVINTLSDVKTEKTGRKKKTPVETFFFCCVISSTLNLHSICIAEYEFKKITKTRMKKKTKTGVTHR